MTANSNRTINAVTRMHALQMHLAELNLRVVSHAKNLVLAPSKNKRLNLALEDLEYSALMVERAINAFPYLAPKE